MKDHVQKPNAVRLLETAGIPFGLVPYEVDENNSISRADVYEALSRCNFSYQERVAIWNGYIEAGNWKSSYDSFRP